MHPTSARHWTSAPGLSGSESKHGCVVAAAIRLGEDLDAVDGLVDRARELAERAVGPVSEAGEEDSQPRIADRLDQRTGEALRAEHLDIAGMKAARRRVDGLGQSKPVRGGGEVTGRRAQCRFAFPPRRRTESRACPSPATPRPLLPVALNVKLAQCEPLSGSASSPAS